jgi:hypothetical protein
MFERWLGSFTFEMWLILVIARLVLTGVTVVVLARIVFALAMRMRR